MSRNCSLDLSIECFTLRSSYLSLQAAKSYSLELRPERTLRMHLIIYITSSNSTRRKTQSWGAEAHPRGQSELEFMIFFKLTLKLLSFVQTATNYNVIRRHIFITIFFLTTYEVMLSHYRNDCLQNALEQTREQVFLLCQHNLYAVAFFRCGEAGRAVVCNYR